MSLRSAERGHIFLTNSLKFIIGFIKAPWKMGQVIKKKKYISPCDIMHMTGTLIETLTHSPNNT